MERVYYPSEEAAKKGVDIIVCWPGKENGAAADRIGEIKKLMETMVLEQLKEEVDKEEGEV